MLQSLQDNGVPATEVITGYCLSLADQADSLVGTFFFENIIKCIFVLVYYNVLVLVYYNLPLFNSVSI